MEHKEQLEVLDLSFAYDKKSEDILKNFSVSFSPGKITAIVGANGCGKSTLLKLLAGVLKPAEGKILLDGQELGSMKRNEAAKRIATVHQNNTAPLDFTVRKLVSAGRTPYRSMIGKNDRDADEHAILQAMRDTDTEQFSQRPIAALSGGQMQRVWLAMALAQQTGILLLDEITTYLDIHYQLEILHLIRRLNEKRGTTILMVLHDINLAYEFCDEAVVLKQGRLLAQGNVNTALSEETLSAAFDVRVKIAEMENKKYCVFGRRGESHERREESR